ncbi:MAG: TetR/AcrR family transcriptional regulator [Corynebacteriales bacterium]|nr:TetR/AcrR family transcriptional regulator [Mycobacteriales bacterium]
MDSDPALLIRLLWRDQSTGAARQGRKQKLDLDTVISAGMALADSEGIAAVSMRSLATRLGVTPMSLYTYVPGKDELLELMLDAAYRDMPRPDFQPSEWRDRLRTIAYNNRALFLAHPWVAHIATVRPSLGPGQTAKYEYELSAFDGTGLDDVTIDDALTYLLTFVHGASRAAVTARQTALETALTDEQWGERHASLLARVFDDQTYPRAARIGAAAGQARGTAYDPDHAFAFGLERVLDGIAALFNSMPGA